MECHTGGGGLPPVHTCHSPEFFSGGRDRTGTWIIWNGEIFVSEVRAPFRVTFCRGVREEAPTFFVGQQWVLLRRTGAARRKERERQQSGTRTGRYVEHVDGVRRGRYNGRRHHAQKSDGAATNRGTFGDTTKSVGPARLYTLLASMPLQETGPGTGPPDALFQENQRIRAGALNLSAVDAGPLSPRERLEARHLIAMRLRMRPEERPSVEALLRLRHPLFWTAADVVAAARAVRARDRPEAELRDAAESAGLGAAYAALADEWRARVHAPLLAALSVYSQYGAGLRRLCRFVRNGHEHPVPWDALPGGEAPARGGPRQRQARCRGASGAGAVHRRRAGVP